MSAGAWALGPFKGAAFMTVFVIVAAYALTLLVMAPFMVTTPYTGFAAAALGGVDYSIFVGLPVAGLLYWWFCRSLDLATERRIVQEEGVLHGVH